MKKHIVLLIVTLFILMPLTSAGFMELDEPASNYAPWWQKLFASAFTIEGRMRTCSIYPDERGMDNRNDYIARGYSELEARCSNKVALINWYCVWDETPPTFNCPNGNCWQFLFEAEAPMQLSETDCVLGYECYYCPLSKECDNGNYKCIDNNHYTWCMNEIWRDEKVTCGSGTYCKEFPTSQGKTGAGCFEYDEEPTPEEPVPPQPAPTPPSIPRKENGMIVNWNLIIYALVGLALLFLALKFLKKKR